MQYAYFKTLLQELPRYAEEKGDFYTVHRDVLVTAITETHGIPANIAETAVGFCERLLETLAVLNAQSLRRGEWCFVSFSAQLLAMSVLAALSDGDSRFFPTDFWRTQDVSADRKDRQRDVLKFVEDARVQCHAKGEAIPIRYAYAAWGIIKLGGKILFRQREDTQIRGDKSAGDYGLVGGRADQTDLQIPDQRTALNALQSANSAIVKSALPVTLQRKVHEETGLLHETHYTFIPWHTLRPYRQVQGPAPYHALTEYHLEIFEIVLNLEGYLHLCRRIKRDKRLVWFSIDEAVSGESTDGKIAYIKALFNDYDNDRERLKEDLTRFSDSFQCDFKREPKKYGMTFPLSADRPVIAGVLGKEKPLDIQLTEQQHAALLGLAAHLKGFVFAFPPEIIHFHPCGWIEIVQNTDLHVSLQALVDTLRGTDIIVESHGDRLFRLSICPNSVLFDEELFEILYDETNLRGIRASVPLFIKRAAFETPFGTAQGYSQEFEVTLDFLSKLIKLNSHEFSSDHEYAHKAEDSYKKTLHKRLMQLGLRGLIRRDSGIIRVTIPCKPLSA